MFGINLQQGIQQCFEAVTSHAAKAMHLRNYGLEVGCHADMVLLQAGDPIEALRLRATRLMVWRRGQLVAQTPAAVTQLQIAGRPASTNLRHFGH